MAYEEQQFAAFAYLPVAYKTVRTRQQLCFPPISTIFFISDYKIQIEEHSYAILVANWLWFTSNVSVSRSRILVQVTIYRRLLIGRDGHLDQSEAYDIS